MKDFIEHIISYFKTSSQEVQEHDREIILTYLRNNCEHCEVRKELSKIKGYKCFPDYD